MMDYRKAILGLICFSTLFLLSSYVYAQKERLGGSELIIFFSPHCQRCQEVKEKIIPELENKFKGKIQIEYRDISDVNNYRLLLSLQEKYKIKLKNKVPIFYFRGRFLEAEAEIQKPLEDLIKAGLTKSLAGDGQLPEIDFITRFKGFRLLMVMSAGLIDGINPCAFTVIVFFISFLALQGYRPRELTIIGLSFIFALFITYALLGLGLFGFLYRLKGFFVISRMLNFSIGIFSISLGILAVYDFWKFRKTKNTAELILQLPPAIKNRIHSIIGWHYRKAKTRYLVFSAFITGFLVTILEAVCTGQTYLPTISFIFKTTPLKLQAFVLLMLYNLMFIVPLLTIFFLALSGVTSEQFSHFLKRHLALVKILMATLFFTLGILIILKQ